MRYLTPAEFSALLWEEYRIKRTVDTLAKLRCIGGSAPFTKAGRAVIYPEQPGREWALALLSPLKTSTTDTGAG